MVVVPPGEFGDFLVADWTNPVLLLPQVKQLPSTLEVLFHFQAETLFKVNFPGRVIGVRCPFDFDVPFNGHTGDVEQVDLPGFPVFVLDLATENPVAMPNGMKVFLFNPRSYVFSWEKV